MKWKKRCANIIKQYTRGLIKLSNTLSLSKFAVERFDNDGLVF